MAQTCSYDFNLTSIVVIDDYGEGIPVAWMVSNKEDTHVLSQFLKAVRRRTGSVTHHDGLCRMTLSSITMHGK